MKKLLAIVFLSFLWSNVGIAAEREPGTDERCLHVFERENIFEKEFLPKAKRKALGGVLVTYVGCNKYYDDWSWDYSTDADIDAAHEKAYEGCVATEMPKYNLTGCHLFSIDDVIVWGKNTAFVAKVEKEAKAKSKTKVAVKKKIVKKKAKAKKEKACTDTYVFCHTAFEHYGKYNKGLFTKWSPTTLKKLTFKKERNISDVSKVEKYGDVNKGKKKLFKSYFFVAEYEGNITLEIFVEHQDGVVTAQGIKEGKDLAELYAFYYSHMYGQMPHFLKTYNKKIYIHKAIGKDDGTWWAMHNTREFHINSSRCGYNEPQQYSYCAVTMAHELAHVIQDFTSVISPSKWMKVRKLDNKKYCSKYAKTNSREDFAESIVCWIGIRHKSDWHGPDNIINIGHVEKINEYMPNRLKFFDELNLNMYPL